MLDPSVRESGAVLEAPLLESRVFGRSARETRQDQMDHSEETTEAAAPEQPGNSQTAGQVAPVEAAAVPAVAPPAYGPPVAYGYGAPVAESTRAVAAPAAEPAPAAETT